MVVYCIYPSFFSPDKLKGQRFLRVPTGVDHLQVWSANKTLKTNASGLEQIGMQIWWLQGQRIENIRKWPDWSWFPQLGNTLILGLVQSSALKPVISPISVWNQNISKRFPCIILQLLKLHPSSGCCFLYLWLFKIAMGNDPFIDGLPVTNGDFPWLC